MLPLPELPLTPYLDDIKRRLAGASLLVLEAPPGTGKTTLLPISLLKEPWLGSKKILLLQPRRLAARSVAERMSKLVGDPLGATVGYRVRLEASVSAATRIEVITEALLIRKLQSDPELSGVGAVLFDEFHERSLASDLGLALALEAAESFRPDLRIVLMSATLGDADFGRIAPGLEIVRIPAAAYPVETRYRDSPRSDIDARAAEEAAALVRETSGGVLVFLPGLKNIRAVMSRLTSLVPSSVEVGTLSGDMPLLEQTRAVLPAAGKARKVILSTPIAETSITVEGVTGVVDSGLAKYERFDPGSGMTRLVTERIAADSAEQRKGRAGRTGPGICVRLWSEAQQERLPALRLPEIATADLAPLLLETAAWGALDPRSLRLLTPPPEAALTEARRTLRLLGAIDDAGALTARGRTMAQLGCHPRIGAALLEARALGAEAEGAKLAALLEDRDPLGPGGQADIEDRFSLKASRVRGDLAGRIERTAAMWEQRIRSLPRGPAPRRKPPRELIPGILIGRAYPERIAMRRSEGEGRYLLALGSGARLGPHDPLSTSELLAVAELHQAHGEAYIRLGARLDETVFDGSRGGELADLVVTESRVEFDERSGGIQAVEERRVGSVILSERPIENPGPGRIREAILGALRAAGGLRALEWSEAAKELEARARLVRAHVPDAQIPSLDDEALDAALDELGDEDVKLLRRRASWSSLDVEKLLRARLGWKAVRALDEHAPESISLPSNRPRRLTYSGGQGAVLEATVQELFGWKDSPRPGSGRIPLLIHILSPARRPVQVTKDLRSFWTNTYPEARRELRGRYPKHAWPESGLDAPAGLERSKKEGGPKR